MHWLLCNELFLRCKSIFSLCSVYSDVLADTRPHQLHWQPGDRNFAMHLQLPFNYCHFTALIHLVSSSMFDLVGPPSNARCPEPSLPSGALPTSQGTCITSTNPLVQVRSGGKEEGESYLASTLPVVYTYFGSTKGNSRHTHCQQ